MNATLNSTTSTSSPPLSLDNYIGQVLTYIVLILLGTSMGLHVFYYLLILTTKEIQKRTFLYTHHVNVVSIFYLLLLFSYTLTKYPNFADATANAVFCAVSEIAWIGSSYLRMYSILLIAIYRYIAVFKNNLYKRINDSLILLISPLILVWVISLGCPIASKYIFSTSVSPILCLDGYSNSYWLTLGYFFFNYSIMALFPSVAIITIYTLITLRLNELGEKLNKKRSTNGSMEVSFTAQTIMSVAPAKGKSTFDEDDESVVNNANVNKRNSSNVALTEVKSRKERRFANQFLIMCTFMILTLVGVSIFQLRNLIPGFYVIWANWRIVIRMWCAINIAVIPLTSIYYHPARAKFIKRLKSKIKPANQN